jgi:hypothetical protein
MWRWRQNTMMASPSGRALAPSGIGCGQRDLLLDLTEAGRRRRLRMGIRVPDSFRAELPTREAYVLKIEGGCCDPGKNHH